MSSYQTYLKAIGRKPIPAHEELRSQRAPGDVELPATARRWWSADVPSVTARDPRLLPARAAMRADRGGVRS